jgi:16S rRNA (cytosine967-C5)-methyltransferase
VVERTLATLQPAERFRLRVESGLGKRDAALEHRLSTLILRWVLRLDDVIEQASGRSLEQIDPRLLGPLRLGAVQLLFFDRIPSHAAVSESVELAASRTRPGSRLVNAVLRKIARSDGLSDYPVRNGDFVRRTAVETSHPPWLVSRWAARWGEQVARQTMEACNRERRASLLVTGGSEKRSEVAAALAADGVLCAESDLSPLGLLVEGGEVTRTSAWRAGDLYPQDEASQCAALIPLPGDGERVLDAAAAPGGKTMSLLSWEPRLRIVAADLDPGRMARLRDNEARARSRFSILVTDVRRPGLSGAFDRVLADLPCTGTGTLRKHPELKWRVGDDELRRLTGRAANMLRGLAPLVAPGGLLIVATCSIEPEENEDQVRRFLDEHDAFRLVDLSGEVHPMMASQVEDVGRWRLLPAEEHDGFTVHVLRRV